MNKSNMKFNLLGLTFILLSSFIYAQRPPIFKIFTFRYDFGVIQEKDGVVKHTFPVENAGGDSLEVLRIKCSAANAMATFTPNRIGPGGKGEITITYDPANDKGKVEKLVSIRTNDPQTPIRQFGISAEVIPSEKTIADQYPARLGNLKLKAKHLALDQILSTAKRIDTFRLYNDWNKTMTLKMKPGPEYISFKIEPAELKPGKEGLIILTYDAQKSGNFGLDIEYFKIETNDSLEPEKLITIGTNIIEDFSYLKGNPDKRAKVHFETLSHDFGNIRDGITVDFSFPIENYGKGDLIIHKTKASCGCTVAKMDKTVLKPGEKSFIRVYFNTSGMSGPETKAVTVVCNDPDNPVTMLSFTAVVSK